MKNIWEDDFVIVRGREGKEIKLTYNEILSISNAINAANGQGSIQYFIDSCSDDLPELAKAAEELLEDNKACKEVWNEYWENISYDTGDMEYEAVCDYVKDYILEKGEDDDE